MEIIRKYYDASNNLLRTDNIYLSYRFSMSLNNSIIAILEPRKITTNISMHGTINYITIEGDYSVYDTSGAPYNYTWASKTLGSGQEVIVDMSDLPRIGDIIISASVSGGFGHNLFGHHTFGTS